MKQILKYEIRMGATTLDLPKEAQVLSVMEQNGRFIMWVKVDPDIKETEHRSFRVFYDIDDIFDFYNDFHFITSFQEVSKSAWHVFEETRK